MVWWQAIVDTKKTDDLPLIICPEFGPKPYQATLPFTDQVVSDNWELNYSMMQLLKETFSI